MEYEEISNHVQNCVLKIYCGMQSEHILPIICISLLKKNKNSQFVYQMGLNNNTASSIEKITSK